MNKHFSLLLGLIVIFSFFFISCEDNELDSNICKVTVKSDGNGTVSITNYIGTSVNILIGNSVEVVATPDEGYAFIGWYVSGNDSPISTDTAFTFITSEDVTLSAKFAKLSDIIIRSRGNGSVSFKDTTGNSRPVLPGTEVTVVATPDKDCDFVGWFVGDSQTPISTESVYTFTVTENIVLTGQFMKRPVITICSAGDGNVSFKDFNGTSVAVRPDTEVTVIATPYKNCDFIGWFIDEPDTLVSTDIEYSFVVTEDIVLIAKFYNGEYINETFATSFGAFTTQQTVGNYPWIIDYSTAKATSYVDGANNAATSWLISDAVDFTNETEAYVAFEYIIRYSESGKVAKNHQLLISADYTGDPAAATWTDLPYGAVEGADWTTFYKANVNVPAEFLGKSGVVFALRYTATTKASTWEVKNFKVAHGTAAEPEEPEEAEEYTVAEALAAFTGVAKPAVVKGYIVGAVDGQVYTDGCRFSGTAESKTNLLIADNVDETDPANCMPVQLPSGAVRNALNLVENPGNYKKQVNLTGSLEKYFGVPGLKTVSKYEIEGVTPEEPETPDTPEVPIGDNILANGGFEEWNGSVPTAWGKDDSNAAVHSATIAQSTEAYEGNYSVIVNGDAKSNKRLASKSYTLPAGTYTYSIYTKTNGSEAGHCRIGYVPIADGKAGTYVYEEAPASAVSANWTVKTLEFTLTEETTIAFVVMNNKTGNGASFLVDNATLTVVE
ncbi:MAG: InlB B-repeat-containing protein [Bacteroidaceae bacterium]|nr:InlB B-repeat-containing protein [Bacteroidaceae bacterium]